MPRMADVLEGESQTVDLEHGDFERLLGRRERKERNRRIRAGAVGVIVALAIGVVLVRSLTSHRVPANRPVDPTPALTVSGALAYSLDGDIYVADPDGSNAVAIAAPDEACEGSVVSSAPSWSPDGGYLAFQRDCLLSVDRYGSATTDPHRAAVVIAYPDGTIVAEIPASGFSWSPDSARLAVWGDGQRTVDIYGVDGVRQASLPSPLRGRAATSAPEWMPEASALVVVGAAPPSEMVVPLDGSPAYELTGRRSDGLSIASPDGTRVAVLGDRSTVVTDADGALVSEVKVPLQSVPVWSPDGERFSSTNRRGDLILVDAASGKVKVLTEARAALSEGEHVNVVRGFSPKGDQILYAALVRDGGSVYNDLYSIGVDGSHPRLLVVGAMQGQWRPR